MKNPLNKRVEDLLQEIVRLQSAAAKLTKLVSSQQEAIQQSELETLEAILRQKQIFIEQLMGFQQAKEAFEQLSGSVSHQVCDPIRMAIQQLEESLSHILHAEQTTIHVAQDHYVEMARQLRALTHHRQATNSYSQTSQTPLKRTIDISG